jgi:hypothetical protein
MTGVDVILTLLPPLEQLSLVLESKTKINPLTKQTETTQSGSS